MIYNPPWLTCSRETNIGGKCRTVTSSWTFWRTRVSRLCLVMARISAHGKMGRNVPATPRLSLETLLRESQQPSISCLLVATMKFGRDFCNTQIGDIIGRHIQHFPNQTFAHGVSSGSNTEVGLSLQLRCSGHWYPTAMCDDIDSWSRAGKGHKVEGWHGKGEDVAGWTWQIAW